jgi:N-acetylglutamate synthase-like GNAT family acetyltransferase
MRIRRAAPPDRAPIRLLAGKLGLDYPGMEGDAFWLAEDDGETVGAIGLIRHPDCLELVGLGVGESRRGSGLGRALVGALLAETPGDVYLATIVPDFFALCGFVRAPSAPASIATRKGTAWCDGCPGERCVVMVRKAA